MMYEEVIKDFAERTKKNLVEIDKSKYEGLEVYETTQLINSCLGLLVFPQQKFINEIPTIPIEELEKGGWLIPKVVGDYDQVSNLNQLIRRLRNAIAHFNIEFIGNGKNEIELLRVWNKNKRGNRNWEAVLSVNDLRKFIDKFSNYLIDNYTLLVTN